MAWPSGRFAGLQSTFWELGFRGELIRLAHFECHLLTVRTYTGRHTRVATWCGLEAVYEDPIRIWNVPGDGVFDGGCCSRGGAERSGGGAGQSHSRFGFCE